MPGSPSSRRNWALGLTLAQAGALVATFFLPGLGAASWHHLASLGLVVALAAVLRGPMRSRRFLAIGVLVATVLATASGFWLLYWKEGIRADGYQDWGVFWHVAWSWAAAVLFWQHTWVNRVALAHFFRRSLQAWAPAALHGGLYGLAVVALAVTWGPGKAWFTSENYVPLGLWTWLVVAVVAYAAWWALRRRPAPDQKRFRGGVDLGLVPIAALAVVSGFPLLWFDGAMDAAGLKYASKFWHVAPSVLFAVLVFAHGAQLWNPTRVHWRRMGGEGWRRRGGEATGGRRAPTCAPGAAEAAAKETAPRP